MRRERMKLENYKCWATPLNFIVFASYKPHLRNIRSFSLNAFVRMLFFAHICLPLIFFLKTMWGMQEGRAASKHCNPLLSQRKWTTERPSLAFTSVLGLTHFCPSVLVFRFLSVCLCIFICVFVNHGETMMVLLSLTSVFQTLRFCELCLSRILHYFHMLISLAQVWHLNFSQ